MITNRNRRKGIGKKREVTRLKNGRLAGSRPASEFKTHCLKLMEDVRKTRRQLIVTRHGRPIVRVVPCAEEVEPVFGFLKGTLTSYSYLTSPINEDWDANDK